MLWVVLKVRRLLIPLTAVWLCLHLVTVTGVAVAAFAGPAPADMVCTCIHEAEHGACPMHRAPSNSTRCRLQSTQNDLAIVLTSLLSPLVLPESRALAIRDALASELIAPASSAVFEWAVPPESPPPRA
jgi:hypothetical protein